MGTPYLQVDVLLLCDQYKQYSESYVVREAANIGPQFELLAIYIIGFCYFFKRVMTISVQSAKQSW